MNRGWPHHADPGAETMSYILDALRRADAERQQGGVPGLHTPPSSPAALPAPQSARLLWGGAAVLLLTLSGALAWWWTRPAVVVNAAAPPATAPASRPVPSFPPPPAAAAPLPIVVSAAPVPAAVSGAVPTAVPGAASPAVQGAASPAAQGAPASAALPPPVLRTVPLQQLANDLRRELPPLVVGGSVWSDSVTSRFVVLDGQVTREGETVAPGLVLERIQPKSVVLRWREMRLEITL